MTSDIEIIKCRKFNGATHSKRTCIARMQRLVLFDKKTGRGGKGAWNFSGAEWAESPYEICRDCEFGRELMRAAGLKLPRKENKNGNENRY